MLGVEVAFIVGLWFVALTLLITYSPIKNLFSKVHYYIMKIMGGALILLGVKLAFETKN
jgi:threonine/homoserine/homoserine lactone efflux protein